MRKSEFGIKGRFAQIISAFSRLKKKHFHRQEYFIFTTKKKKAGDFI